MLVELRQWTLMVFKYKYLLYKNVCIYYKPELLHDIGFQVLVIHLLKYVCCPKTNFNMPPNQQQQYRKKRCTPYLTNVLKC